MRHNLNRRSILALGATIFGPFTTRALASDAAATFPDHVVHVVVPQAAGGAADTMARFLAAQLGTLWHQSVIVDNKPGGGSALATAFVTHSQPDGYTIGTAGSSLTINAVLRKKQPYELSEVLPIARIGYYTTALVATPGLAANNVRELIALAKTQPLNFGSNGVGSAAHLAGELLNEMAGLQMQHVPYNGATKMYGDMIGGRLQLGFAIASSAEPFVKRGQLKVIGVTNATRSPLFPDWPAISETLPGYEAINWAGIYGPVGIAPEIVGKLSATFLEVLRNGETRKTLTALGIEVAEQGSAEFAAFLKSDVQRIARLAKTIGTLE
jgi:tripartite-type tricarboxylate transporter receptor subunit TctC